MGFLDKVKETAKGVAGKAQEKIEDLQERRKADDMLDDLGRLLYAQRTGRAPDDAEAQIERLVGALRALEEAGVDLVKYERDEDTTPPAPPLPPPAPEGQPLPPPMPQ